jgi:hypothetical protein
MKDTKTVTPTINVNVIKDYVMSILSLKHKIYSSTFKELFGLSLIPKIMRKYTLKGRLHRSQLVTAIPPFYYRNNYKFSIK